MYLSLIHILKPQDIRIIPIDRLYTDRDGVYLVMSDGSSLIITEQGEILVSWQEGQIEKVSTEQQRYQINLENGITEIRDFKGNVIEMCIRDRESFGENSFSCLRSLWRQCFSVCSTGRISGILLFTLW